MERTEGNPRKLQFQLKDCQTVVENKLKITKFKIIKHQLLPIDNVFGYFGEHVQLSIKLEYDKKVEEILFFAKFFPRPHLQQDYDLVSGAFKKEIFVYEELLPKIQNAGISLPQSIVPKCYYTNTNHVIIFEDLTKRGFERLTRYQYLDYDTVVTVIKALAKLHASSLIYEEKTSDSLDKYFAQYNETFYSPVENHKGRICYLAAVKAIKTEIDYFNLKTTMTKQEFKIRARKACYKIFDLVKPSKKYRNVICHGDLWSTNFLIRYQNPVPSECMLIDFQISRFAPPSQDVMGLLYITTSRSFRKQYMKKLCKFYYNELTKHVADYGYDLNKLIPYREFIESCEEQKIFSSAQTATYYQMINMKSDYMDEIVKDEAKWLHTLYEDRSTIVLENCQRDEDYKNKLKDTLKNLRDICENNTFD